MNPVAETIEIEDDGSSRLQEASFLGRTDHSLTSTSSGENPICQGEKIADIWCLDSEDDKDKGTRSVSLQVSLDDVNEDNEEGRNTLSLACSQVNSQGNVLFLEDSLAPDNLSFLTSLSLECPSEDCHPEARKYLSHFSRHKEELLQRLFTLFNQKAFNSALPKDLVFAWNPRLTKTAGVCINRKIRIDNAREERISKIELSSKVIDCAERLRDTLLHELCHAMTWIRHGVRDGHGQFFRYFAQEAMKSFPQIEVTRCHR